MAAVVTAKDVDQVVVLTEVQEIIRQIHDVAEHDRWTYGGGFANLLTREPRYLERTVPRKLQKAIDEIPLVLVQKLREAGSFWSSRLWIHALNTHGSSANTLLLLAALMNFHSIPLLPEHVLAQVEYSCLFVPSDRPAEPHQLRVVQNAEDRLNERAGSLEALLYTSEFCIVPVWMVVLPLLVERLSPGRAADYFQSSSWIVPRRAEIPKAGTYSREFASTLQHFHTLLLVAEQLEMATEWYRLTSVDDHLPRLTVDIFRSYREEVVTPLWLRFWVSKALAGSELYQMLEEYRMGSRPPGSTAWSLLFALVVALIRLLGPTMGRPPGYYDALVFPKDILVDPPNTSVYAAHIVDLGVDEKEEIQHDLQDMATAAQLRLPGIFQPSFVVRTIERHTDWQEHPIVHAGTWRARLLFDSQSRKDVERALVALDVVRNGLRFAFELFPPSPQSSMDTHATIGPWRRLFLYLNDLLDVPVARRLVTRTLADVADVPEDVSSTIVSGYWSSLDYQRRRRTGQDRQQQQRRRRRQSGGITVF